jgi:hypothetical protein
MKQTRNRILVNMLRFWKREVLESILGCVLSKPDIKDLETGPM